MIDYELNKRFIHHPPSPERAEAHAYVRSRLHFLAEDLDRRLPDGREKSLVMTKLEEAMFWANAAIAREGVDSEG
jgi:hypothetical protein